MLSAKSKLLVLVVDPLSNIEEDGEESNLEREETRRGMCSLRGRLAASLHLRKVAMETGIREESRDTWDMPWKSELILVMQKLVGCKGKEVFFKYGQEGSFRASKDLEMTQPCIGLQPG